MMNKFLAAILPAMSCALNTVAATTVAVWDAAQAGASIASGKWNVILDGELRRNLGCEIRTDGNSLTLSVKAPGMTLIVR